MTDTQTIHPHLSGLLMPVRTEDDFEIKVVGRVPDALAARFSRQLRRCLGISAARVCASNAEARAKHRGPRPYNALDAQTCPANRLSCLWYRMLRPVSVPRQRLAGHR